MENKLYSTTRRKKENIINLFPDYFKKIGITLILLSLLLGLVSNYSKTTFLHLSKESLNQLRLDILIIGLMLLVWAKDKVEDEMTMLLRLKAIEWTFSVAAMYVILRPILDNVFNDAKEIMTSQETIIYMLIVYITVYKANKR